jgi:hypothetical protein
MNETFGEINISPKKSYKFPLTHEKMLSVIVSEETT